MKIPSLRGLIRRRVLVNFRANPEVVARYLPKPFRPQVIHGQAIVGVCLIGLRDIRPLFVPAGLGVSSENAAHRIAVGWDEGGQTKRGVFIPRRDTNSRVNALVGGRVFPGFHHLSHFDVHETDRRFEVAVNGKGVSAFVAGEVGAKMPEDSVFQSLDEASRFFQAGGIGYSVTPEPSRFQGLELRCRSWRMEVLNTERAASSFYEDTTIFPAGSVKFDCALLMRNIDHEWHSQADLCGDSGTRG